MGTGERERLVATLRELGASDAEIAAAESVGALGELAVEIALRRPGQRVAWADAIARAGVDADRAATLWQSLGLPDPGVDGTTLTTSEVDTLADLVRFGDVLGADGIGRISRVLGSSAARIAETVVEVMRVNFELPRLGEGVSYPDVVDQYSAVASAAYPRMTDVLDVVLRRQIVAFVRNAWTPSEDRRSMNLERLVGFVDIVGFTELSASLGHSALADLVTRFEQVVASAVAAAGGRIVKTIGDEVMFVVADVSAGVRAATVILDSLGDRSLPPARIGIAAGPVTSYGGDYFGAVVNLAARLVAVAEPMTALAAADVTPAANETGIATTPHADVMLKGFTDPVAVVELRRVSTST